MGNVDPTYGVNDFNKAKVLTEAETYVTNIMTILFGKPGFYPSIPNLGMDIKQYLYQFEDEIDTNKLKSKLASQCSDFLPVIESGEMDILTTQYEGRTMLIFQLQIIVDKNQIGLALGVTVNAKGEMVYNFVTSEENTNQII